ncbi:MAG: hypothetical protein RLP44_23360 [Aggregatilineales bacterium]
MRDDVRDLIAKIEGDDPSARENAVLDLMYRMEDSTKHIFKNGVVIDDKYLSQDEQIELIHTLIKLAESLRPEYASLLFVVSKGIPIIMIDPVQDFVLKYADVMPNHMLQQSLVALWNCMRPAKGSRDYETIKEKMKYDQIMMKLRRIEMHVNMLERVLKDTLSCIEVFSKE